MFSQYNNRYCIVLSILSSKFYHQTIEIAESIAQKICLIVLLIAVSFSTLPYTILILHITADIKPKPAPQSLMLEQES